MGLLGERLQGALKPGAAPSGWLYTQLHLVVTRILPLLRAHVRSDHLCIPTNRGPKVPTGPEHFAGEMALPAPKAPGTRHRTFTLDIPYHLRHRLFRWNTDTDMHVIGHEVSFYNRRFLVLRQLMEDFPQMLAQLAENLLLPLLWKQHDRVLTVPSRVA